VEEKIMIKVEEIKNYQGIIKWAKREKLRQKRKKGI